MAVVLGRSCRGDVRATLRIRLHRARDGSIVANGNLAAAPLWCRWDGTTLWLVGSAASPVGEDRVDLHLEVADGVTAVVRSVAAMVVYAAEGAGTAMLTTIDVGSGASLHWHPEPVIVTARARHRTTARVRVAGDAHVTVDEVVLLGRSDERCGALHSTLELAIDETTTALTSFDTSTPGWNGPGGVGGAHVVATRLQAGDPAAAPAGAPLPGGSRTDAPATPHGAAVTPCGALLRPEGGGRLAVVCAAGVEQARAELGRLCPSPSAVSDLLTV